MKLEEYPKFSRGEEVYVTLYKTKGKVLDIRAAPSYRHSAFCYRIEMPDFNMSFWLYPEFEFRAINEAR